MPPNDMARMGTRPTGKPFIVGVIQHPTTSCWQPYVAEGNADGTDIEVTLISSHHDRPFAQLTAQICFQSLERGQHVDLATMVQRSQESESPVDLPPDSLKTLMQALRPQLQRQ